VLNGAQHDSKGVGLLSVELADSFANSELFGAPLKSTFIGEFNLFTAGHPFNGLVMTIAATMVILMTASQFYTQLQIMAKNMSPEAKNSPMFRQQRILLYILPLVFAVSGVAFPLGVMFYWLTSNFWTMGQQFLVIRNMPTPGSEAAKAREARLAKRGKLPEAETGTTGGDTLVIEEKRPTQRSQPVGKARAKKSGGKKR
jgi:YidC/Oxa1 family membrane protein insertase